MNEALRRHFPLLSRRIDGKPLAYLDSAATSLKPDSVLAAERAYGTDFTANVHRGKHTLSEEASTAFENARRRVARALATDPSNVVFTANTTHGLNLVAQSLLRGPDARVLVSSCEHHSNFVPWLATGKAHVFDPDPERALTPEALEKLLERHRPTVFAFSYASNVTGVVQPVKALCDVARARGVTTVLDAAQGAPHFTLELDALGCDFLAFSAHKMLGPTGIGVLAGAPEQLERIEPIVLGGGTVDRVTRDGFTLKKLPFRLEAGTPSISAALGLAAAFDFLDDVGIEAIGRHAAHQASLLERELEGLRGMRLLMSKTMPRLALATLAPTHPRVEADQLALLLSDSHQIMVRSGFHCAHPLFDLLGIEQGALRVSAYLYTTDEELLRFSSALKALLERMVPA